MLASVSHINFFTVVMLVLHVVVQTVAAVLMFAKCKRHSDRSCLFIAFFFLTSAIASIGEIVIALCAADSADGVLLMDPQIILCGFAIFFLLVLYSVEMLRPGWLDWRRVLILLSPWIILVAGLEMFHHFDIRPLHSLTDMAAYIHEPNVWLRVLLTFIYLPYGVWLLVMQHNWRNSSAPMPWLRVVVVLTLCMTVTYFCSRGLRLFWGDVVHEILYMGLTILILYIELAVRLYVPDNKMETTYSPPVVELDLHDSAEALDVIAAVAERITQAMENPDVWQNPELTQDGLIRLVGTNRRYCQMAIRQLGYDSYPDMINRRRVKYIQQQLSDDPTRNLQNLFYEAGYRSRTSAWRNFTTIVGCSPTDFCAAL